MINFSSKSWESLRLKLFVKCQSKIENCAGKMQILCVSRSKLCRFFTKVRSGVKVQSKSSEPILIPFRFHSDCGAEDSQRSPGSMAWHRPNPYLTGGGVKEGPILTHPPPTPLRGIDGRFLNYSTINIKRKKKKLDFIPRLSCGGQELIGRRRPL